MTIVEVSNPLTCYTISTRYIAIYYYNIAIDIDILDIVNISPRREIIVIIYTYILVSFKQLEIRTK